MRNRTARLKNPSGKKRSINPLRFDPTRTHTERTGLEREIRQRYARLKRAILDFVGRGDATGLDRFNPLAEPNALPFTIAESTPEAVATSNPWASDIPSSQKGEAFGRFVPTGNAEPMQADTNPNKVKRFRAWLRQQMETDLAGDEVIQAYIDAGYRKGNTRAFDDLRRKEDPPTSDPTELSKRRGERDQFVRGRMNKTATVDKVKLLASRTFSELDDVNSKMATRMTRILTDAMVMGWKSDRAAREMVEQIGIEESRAVTIVRTELIRAHAEGQLDAMAEMGEENVTPQVEWTVAADSKTCPQCSKMDGRIVKVEDARGLIPVHPNCRCAWVPVRERKTKGRKGKT